ncbi:Ger(x)C family spore germination protein [Paenibacillus sp. CC-CFT747]|nr:Ger(x)C family spore germination protein [Paenibacillus sp. CC-CFT747]
MNRGIPRLAVSLLAAVVLLGTLPGCWGIKDINHRVLPTVMGISHGEGNRYKVTLQVPIPGPNKTEVRIVNEEAETLTKALDRIKRNMENQVDLLHMKLIVLHEEVAEKSIRNEVEYAVRSREIATKAFLAVTDRDITGLLRSTQVNVEREGTTFLNFFGKQAGWTPAIPIFRVWEAYRGLHAYTQDGIIPIVRPAKEGMIQFVGSGVIKQDRMVSRITPDETVLLNIYRNNFQGAVIEVMEQASVSIVRAKVTNKPRLVKGQPRLTIDMTLSYIIQETKGSISPDQINQELEKLVAGQFQTMITKLKRDQADIFGFGQFFRGRLPYEELKNWRSEYYPQLDIELRVKATMRNSGLMNIGNR